MGGLKVRETCTANIWGWGTSYQFRIEEQSCPVMDTPLETNWFMAPASPQVSSASATVKVVVVDSVTAVVSPLLGGQQREGKRCGRAHSPGHDLASQL